MSLLVGQREYAFTTGSRMVALGVVYCICIVAYDEKSKKTLLINVDDATHRDSIRQLLKRIPNPKVHIITHIKRKNHGLVKYITSKYDTTTDFTNDREERNVIVDDGKVTIIQTPDTKKLIIHSKFYEHMHAIAENPGKINILGIEGYDDGFVYDKDDDVEEQYMLLRMQLEYVQEENMKHDLPQKSAPDEKPRGIMEKDEIRSRPSKIVHTMDFSLRPMPYQPGYSAQPIQRDVGVQHNQTDPDSKNSTMEDVD